MTEYEHKHLKPEPDSDRAYCGVTTVPRMIPEGAGVCPVCHEGLIHAMHMDLAESVSRTNRMLMSVSNFGSALRGYVDGLNDSDNESPKVEKVLKHYDSMIDDVAGIVAEANSE